MLSVLSIEIEHDSNFAVMDIFRCFDRTGRGSVYMLEFVLGVIDKIRALRKNLVLEDIADELLKLEAVPSELANKLEKGIFSAGGNKLSASFNTHMKAFSVYVRGILRSMSARSSTPKHGGYFNSIALPPSPTLLKGGAISTEAESSITLLTKASLVGCFCQAIDLAVSDTMQYFHISPQYMTGLLIESSTSTTDEVVYRENPEGEEYRLLYF